VHANSIGPLDVTWRGRRYQLAGDRLIIHGAGLSGSSICLWPPRHDALIVRDQWVADTVIRDFGGLEGKGETAQQALDALAAALPVIATPMVRGGNC
jgi:hypothetical protein